jgi:hypothetical protein
MTHEEILRKNIIATCLGIGLGITAGYFVAKARRS